MNGEIVLKPYMVSAMIPRLVFTLMLGALLGVLAGYFLFPLAGVGAFILVMSFNLLSYFNLKSREYRFKSEQVEVYEGFLNVTQSNVSYNRVTDISLNKPVSQRIFGTGTIHINTAGGNIKEINIGYVKNPDGEFQRVKQLTGSI